MEDKSFVESQRPVQPPADLYDGDHLLDAYESPDTIISFSTPERLTWDFRNVLSSDPATSEAVQNFLRSMQGNQSLSNAQSQQNIHGDPFTTLPDLLPPAITIPVIDSAPESSIDHLLSHLPPQLLLLSQEADGFSSVDPTSETVNAAMQALSISQKREILRKVLRSPQFSQSLGSLTAAIRDGGLPSISDALKIPVENGGFLRRGGVPIGGGDAVEAFLKGVRMAVGEESQMSHGAGDDSHMDTS